MEIRKSVVQRRKIYMNAVDVTIERLRETTNYLNIVMSFNSMPDAVALYYRVVEELDAMSLVSNLNNKQKRVIKKTRKTIGKFKHVIDEMEEALQLY